MKSVRLIAAIVVAAVVAVVSVAIAAPCADAQSANTRPAPALHHMAHSQRDPAADPCQLVSLPTPIRHEMLASMRDHLKTLNAVIGYIADAKFDAASRLTETRLGMSSLPLHHAAALAPYLPAPMQQAGTRMHHAASRLAIALEDASVIRTFDAMRKVNAALHDVTSYASPAIRHIACADRSAHRDVRARCDAYSHRRGAGVCEQIMPGAST